MLRGAVLAGLRDRVRRQASHVAAPGGGGLGRAIG